MKRFKLLLTIALVAMLSVGCKQPPIDDGSPTMAVTYTTIDGVWAMTHWNGAPIDDQTNLYITFLRKEQRFEMWSNIGSMYFVQSTGEFRIEQDQMKRYILKGWYDYGAGDWSNDYVVVLDYPGDRMLLKALGNGEVMEFNRIEALPEF